MPSNGFRLNFEYRRYASASELEPQDQQLLQEAAKARENAYAPYSNFLVGAAIRLANGEVATGSNQENAAFPSGLCAERVCAFHAGARFPGVGMEVLAISAGHRHQGLDSPPVSCGACRQSLLEYEQRQGSPIRILMAGTSGGILEAPSVESLLPFPFRLDQ